MGGEILGFERRKVALTLGAGAVLAAGAVGLVGQIADFGEMLDAVREADARWLALCAAGQALSYGGYILAYRDVARVDGGPELPYWTVTRIVAAAFGAHALGSAPGGLAVDFWAINRAGPDVHETARRVLAFNTLEWAVIGIFAAVASAAVLAGSADDVPQQLALAWLAGFGTLLAAALWVGRSGHGEHLARLRGPRLRKALANAIGGLVLLRRLLARPGRYPAGLAGFPLFWAGHLLTLYGGLRAFTGEEIALAALVLGFVTGYLVTAVPLPAGGTGPIEASLAFSLHLVGVPLAPALLAVLVYRFCSFWLPLAPAALLLPGLGRLSAQLPRTPRERQ